MALPTIILGPQHIHPTVRTEADYLAWHARTLQAVHIAYPNMSYRAPWEWAGAVPDVFVSGGKALIECPTLCGNFPAVDLTWGIACCAEPGCGAIVRNLQPPARWSEIEAELVKRPVRAWRHWEPGTTVDDLKDENRKRGLPVDEKVEERV